MVRKKQARDESDNTEREPAEAEGGETVAGESVSDAATVTEDLQASDNRFAELEQEIESWKDRYSRAIADMENLRRRTLREAEDARKFANERLISDLLPVLDNFSRALEAAGASTDQEALKAGVEQIQRQMVDVLERAGLERIEAVGQPFDPNLHEAIMQVEPQDGQESHQVVDELRAGYRLNERVVRPALVRVTSG